MGPSVLEREGTKLLAAIDPDAGGTWLAVNEYGLCVFLLNNYQLEALLAEPPLKLKSRGEIPLRYASFRSKAAALNQLQQANLSNYCPCLIALADVKGVDLFSWDGSRFEILRDVDGFITTSSFRTSEVETYRKSRHEMLLAGRTELSEEERRRMHLETPHPNAAFNPMMLRSDSRTQSVSTVSVDATGVRFLYETVRGESRQLGEANECFLPKSVS